MTFMTYFAKENFNLDRENILSKKQLFKSDAF